MKKLFSTLSILVTSVLTAIGCPTICTDKGPIDAKVWSQVDKMVYHFTDSSLPPDYHRSYTVTVTKTEASLKVYSYGNELLSKTYKLKAGQFQKAVEAVKKLGIESKKKTQGVPCSGGTSESFDMYAGEQNLFSGYQDNCEHKLSTMTVWSETIPQALGVVFPQTIEELVNTTRVR